MVVRCIKNALLGWMKGVRPNANKKMLTCRCVFEIGETYLFHPTDPTCDSRHALWGVFQKKVGGTIWLESSSADLRHFQLWCRLPEEYRYCRRSTREELRDYTACSVFWSMERPMDEH